MFVSFLLAPAAGHAQDLSSVIDLTVRNEQHYRIPGATVRLDADPRAQFTDEAGRLRIAGLPPGAHSIHVQVLGYRPSTVNVHLIPDRTHDITVVLTEDPILVGGVQVEVDRSDDQLDFMRGFHERMRRGFGYFLTREDIEKRGSTDLSNLLRTVPGIHSEPTRFGQARIRAARSHRSNCRIGVYIDRVRYRLADDLPGISTKDIQAIEVYRSRSELPAEFADPDLNCGVIVIWSRRYR